MLLFPGFIDAHTHFDLDVCNTTTGHDFAVAPEAALRGGTTTIIDFACPNRGERRCGQPAPVAQRRPTASIACDCGTHATIDDRNETIELGSTI